MAQKPQIKPGDWIRVENHDCVVKKVYSEDSIFGKCLVVFNKKKPTTHDVDWDGEKWFFPERPDYGGYGDITDPYVQQLKRSK